MKYLVSLCVLAIVGLAAADDRCAWGESYWCSSLKAAKTCGAFQHCMTTVWPNQKLKPDGSDICTYCKNVVQDVKNYISNKQTQAQIKQFLASACSIIPVKQMAQECQESVDKYLPEILDMITSELDPQVVCGLLSLCSGLEDKVHHPPLKSQISVVKMPPVAAAPAICTDCKKFLQDIKDTATSAVTEKEVEQLIEQNLCSQLGSLEEECKSMVEAYVPEVMQLLASDFDPAQICAAMGFCNQTTSSIRTLLARMKIKKCPLYKAASLTSDPGLCEVCKVIAGELQNMDKDKATQEEIEQFVKTQICSRLGAMKGACDESVDMYGPVVFQFLATELDPATFCAEMGLCSAKPISNQIPVKPLPAPKVKASSSCVLCEFVVRELDHMLASNATEAEIVAALDKVCSILPSTVRQECLDFVNTYGPGILTLLEEELNPALICSTLGLCGKQQVMASVRDTELCGVCETLLQYIDSLLTQNATIQDIEMLLEKVCNFLPSAMKTECDQIINTYGPMIAQLISQFADPREICTEIGLCKNTSKTVPMETIVPSKSVLVGTKECTYGPSFWCASKENARKCKAEAHCKKHVWNV